MPKDDLNIPVPDVHLEEPARKKMKTDDLEEVAINGMFLALTYFRRV